MSSRVDQQPAWRALAAQHGEIGKRHLRAVRRRPRTLGATELAGEPILQVLAKAPGSGAAIGGIKVPAASGWFAAAAPPAPRTSTRSMRRASPTPNICNGSWKEAQAVVDRAIAAPSRRGT